SRLHMVAIQIGCNVREDTLLSDSRLTDFWAEADRLGVPIAVHGPALPSLFRSYFDLNRPDHMLEASHMAHTFAQMLACSNIVTSGLLERFRNLKVAFLEAGAGWGAVRDAPHGRVQRGRARALGAHLGEAERVHQGRPRVLQLRARRRVHLVLR